MRGCSAAGSRSIVAFLCAAFLVAGCGGDGTSAGLTLPEDAPSHVRQAYREAEKAEEERDELEREAIDVVEDVPVPTGTPTPSAPPPDPSPSPSGDVSPPASPTDPGQPADPPPSTSPVKGAQLGRSFVPQEIAAAVRAWVDAQKEWIRRCIAAQAEVDEVNNSGVGRITQPLCEADTPPPELVPWIRILGIDVDSLKYG
ncbi:hypothetical protein GCM10010517_21930 [Streptosporangium fragile]|uniref:Uncharacterized protein n=1 Tax=Streptosporangium fragile TaxID=46186 RepID=A0ABP6IDL1_9ACTN